MDKEEKIYESTFIPPCPLPSGPLFRGTGDEVRTVCGAYSNSQNGPLNIISDHLEGRVEGLSLFLIREMFNLGKHLRKKNSLYRNLLPESTTSYPEPLVGKCLSFQEGLMFAWARNPAPTLFPERLLYASYHQALGYAWVCACLSWAP